MELREKIENVNILLTTSFINTVIVRYDLTIPNGNITTYQIALKKLQATNPNELHTGFTFNLSDIQQWSEDLEFLINYYKILTNSSNINSNKKLRDLIEDLTPELYSKLDTKKLLKEVIEEIQKPKEIENEISEFSSLAEISLKYDMKAQMKPKKGNKKSNESA